MKFTLRKKLFGGFLSVLIILTLIVVIGLYEITSVDKEYRNLINDRVNKLVISEDLGIEAKNVQSSFRGYIISKSDKALENFSLSHDTFQKQSGDLQKKLISNQAKELLDELVKAENSLYEFGNRMVPLIKQNKEEEYIHLISTEGADIIKAIDQHQNKFIEFQQISLDEESQSLTKRVSNIRRIVLLLGISAIILGLAIAFYIGKLISAPVVKLAKAAEKIASGDLTLDDIKIKNRDEIGDLAKSFNQMAQNLRNIIHQVGSSATHVAATSEELTASADQTGKATEQIAETIQSVAVGSENQVRGVEETSTAINEVSIGIQQIAANANVVSSSAILTSEKALEGNKSIQIAANQMNSINQTVISLSKVIKGLGDRSIEISKINNVITDIAAQTNLLALNAAIEAARAAEHGRGFSVVAEEVRKLAEQSAQSAQQISELISMIQEETENAVLSMENATKEVNEGIIVVNTVGTSFDEIFKSINEVTTQIQEVSAAAEEISAGTEQVVTSSNTITKIAVDSSSSTQSVAAAVEEQLASMEEISASAAALSNMAEELQLLIRSFKV